MVVRTYLLSLLLAGVVLRGALEILPGAHRAIAVTVTGEGGGLGVLAAIAAAS